MFVSAKTLATFAIMAAVLIPVFATTSESDLAVDVIDDTRPSEPFLEGVEAIRTMEDAPHRKLMGGITYYCCCVNCLGGKTVYPWQPCDPGIPKLLGTCNPLTCQSHRLCWNH